MTTSLKASFAAFIMSSALAGVAAPALADTYYPGIDPHNPPGTQTRQPTVLPQNPTFVDPTATGSIDGRRVAYPNESYQERYHTGEGEYYRGIMPPTP